MFDQIKAMKAMAALMGNRDELKAKVEQMQAELARKTVQADAGAGAVRVTANGKLQIVAITLDPAMIATLSGPSADENRAMIEEMLVAATNEALIRAQELARDEMARLAGGFNLPGLEAMMGG